MEAESEVGIPGGEPWSCISEGGSMGIPARLPADLECGVGWPLISGDGCDDGAALLGGSAGDRFESDACAAAVAEPVIRGDGGREKLVVALKAGEWFESAVGASERVESRPPPSRICSVSAIGLCRAPCMAAWTVRASSRTPPRLRSMPSREVAPISSACAA